MTNNKQKWALVTGGSGGIGRAICLQLAAAGHRVLVHANQGAQRAQAVVQEIAERGGAADVLVFDVTDAEQTTQALQRWIDDEPIQIIVNNAGVHDDAPFAGMQPEQWSRVIDVSLNGFYNVTQPLLLPMLRTRWGRIVNITSVAALSGNRGQVNYAAAKGAVHSATKALSLEIASRGVTVNAVAPGIIDTAMSEGHFDATKVAELVPAKRAGRPQEVAALVTFLCSDEAGYISGQVISINGGML